MHALCASPTCPRSPSLPADSRPFLPAPSPQLLANNEKTYWVPSYVKEKRFHNWLENARDWVSA